MKPDLVFLIANTIVLPQWLIMVVAPRWQPTKWLIRYLPIPALLALLYIYYLINGIGNFDYQSFNTLAGLRAAFSSDETMLAGWIHYLAFDLVTGSWILQSSQRRKVPHIVIIPCLLLCFLLGPVGFLLYWPIRLKTRRSSSSRHEED
ncbi:ABA4-like family protein [Tellurirhabdus bombi]|uniref:ABA4-like family protein n=1 Tax=Tellurirhabdus bombi TaxID=2907205 RepID=UPI001F418A11|nr:ABA4-like family protein [Tellurirhabdus bombi]